MEISDSNIISGLEAGDYKIFNLLFVKYYNRLCAFVYEFANDRDITEDIVQELFIRIWVNRERNLINGNLCAYLFKAAKNSALNHLRNLKCRELALKNLPEKEILIDDDFLVQEEFRILLGYYISQLPERRSEIFALSRIDGLSHKEISEKLNISVKTVKNQLWTALSYLKARIELNGGF